MSILFSIIIPVYNVQDYLVDCVNSVLNQDKSNYEIILIDDGSKDGSGKICDKISASFANVKVIHQENRGLSAARNVGIINSKGEYVIFLDSDDMLNDKAIDMLEKAVITKCDIYTGYVLRMNEDKSFTAEFPRRNSKYLQTRGLTFFNQYIGNNTIEACVPFNIYRRSFLVCNKLFFKEGILHEDEWWTPQVFSKARTVEDINYDFYIYRIRKGSITRTDKPKTKNGKCLIQTCTELEHFFKEYKRQEVSNILDHLSSIYMSGVYIGKIQKSKEVDRYLPIRCAKKLKNRLKASLFAISPSLYCNINKIIKKD